MNALAALGVRRSEDELATLCGTTVDGTSPVGLMRGLKQLQEVSPAYLREVRSDVAILRLAALLRSGRPVILCVDDFGHWVAGVGMVGDRFLVADPADPDLVLSYDAHALRERWEGPTRPSFIGVAL